MTDHLCDGWGNRGGTLSPCPLSSYTESSRESEPLLLPNNALTVSHIYFNEVSLKAMFTYCLLDGLCAFHDMNLVVFGTVLLPVKIRKMFEMSWNQLGRSKNRYKSRRVATNAHPQSHWCSFCLSLMRTCARSHTHTQCLQRGDGAACIKASEEPLN